MKLLTGLFTGFLLIVLGGVSHAQSPSAANPLVGEWEFVAMTMSADDTSLTRPMVGSVKVDSNSFSGQCKNAEAPNEQPLAKLSGTYTVDESKSVVVVFAGADNTKFGFKYSLVPLNLVPLNNKNSLEYLELEFSLRDTVDQGNLNSLSPRVREDAEAALEELNRLKFSVLLKRK